MTRSGNALASLRVIFGTGLLWLSVLMTGIGLLGWLAWIVYGQWSTGFDSGAPFSIFAGPRFLMWLIRYMWDRPALVGLLLVGVIGFAGIIASHCLVDSKAANR